MNKLSISIAVSLSLGVTSSFATPQVAYDSHNQTNTQGQAQQQGQGQSQSLNNDNFVTSASISGANSNAVGVGVGIGTNANIVSGQNTNTNVVQGGAGGGGGHGGAGGQGGTGIGGAGGNSTVDNKPVNNNASGVSIDAKDSSSLMSPQANLSLTTISEATKIPPPAPNGILSVNQPPSLFANPTDTGAVKGWDLIVNYVKSCKPIFNAGAPSIIDMQNGDSGMTKIAFWMHPQSFVEKTFTVTDSSKWCDPNDAASLQSCYQDEANSGVATPITPESVSPTFPSSTQGTCLGIISVEGAEKENALPVHVISDAINYVVKNIKGYGEVNVISARDLMGFALEVDNKAKGFGVSPGGSLVSGGASGLLTALFGFGMNSGSTGYNLRPGNTFLVISPKNTGTTIDLTKIYSVEQPAQAPAAAALAAQKVSK